MLQDERYAKEAKQWMELVRKNASRTPDVQVVDAYYSLLTGNYPAVHQALDKASKLPLNDNQKNILASLSAEVAKRESGK